MSKISLSTFKVVHLCTHDTYGGAAMAAYRLHCALINAGIESCMIVRHKSSNDDTVFELSEFSWAERLNKILCHFFHMAVRRIFRQSAIFSTEFFGAPSRVLIKALGSPDIIHLHWTQRFLTAKNIRAIADATGTPILWSPLDLAPMTGGCHYSGDCEGYTRACGRCPQLRSLFSRDLSSLDFNLKKQYLTGMNITIVSPTSWVEQRAHRSSIFKSFQGSLIPLAVDDILFSPKDKSVARQELGLSPDTYRGKTVFFFGANSILAERKGFSYLEAALNKAKKDNPLDNRILLLVAGGDAEQVTKRLPYPAVSLGFIADDKVLALAYQAADCFICPTTDDAGPMMIVESMLCGTPVLAFNTGGAPDLIETGRSGYLAKSQDANDLAVGINYFTGDQVNVADMSAECRRRAQKRHSPNLVAIRITDLYRKIATGSNPRGAIR